MNKKSEANVALEATPLKAPTSSPIVEAHWMIIVVNGQPHRTHCINVTWRQPMYGQEIKIAGVG